MKLISQIQLLEDGFQAVFADGTMKLYKELIAVDFDGEADASYTNSQLDFSLANIDVLATVGASDQAAILEKLNDQAADGVLYINAAQAAALPKAAYSTIYVGDTDAFANLGSFAGIAETTGAFAAAKGDNAFVITGADFNADSLVSTIAHEAGHLMGTIEHDYENDGITLDDFGTAWPTGRINQTGNTNTQYEGVKSGRTATGVDGAAVRFAGGTMTIGKAGTVTSLNDNSAGWGGAISVDTDGSSGSFSATSKLTIQNATLSNNKAIYGGGALNISNGKTSTNLIAEISDCIFSGNTVTGSEGYCLGGAIFADKSSVKFKVSGSTFTDNVAQHGGAIAMRCATATIEDSVFEGNSGAIYMACPSDQSGSPTLTLSGCEFKTAFDTIIVGKNGKLTLGGTNTFAASVTKVSGGTITGADNAKYIFTQSTPISFQMTKLGTDSSVTFEGCQDAVTFNIDTNSFSAAKTTVNTSKGIVGDVKHIGSNVTWLDNSSTVTMNGKNVEVGSSTSSALYLEGGELYAETRFAGRARSVNTGTDSIDFVGGRTYTEDFGAVTLGGNKDVNGQGTDKTILKGTLYADGHSLDMSDLTYTGVIYGANTTGSTATNCRLKLDGVVFDSSTSTSRIYGGGKVAAAGGTLTLGNVNVILGSTAAVDLGTKASVYGAGYVKGDNSKLETGDITLDINAVAVEGTTVPSVYGGAYVNVSGTEKATVQLGKVTTTIRDGHFDFAGNGSYVSSTASASSITQGDSTLTIEGGIFEGCVYAGGYSRGADTAKVDGNCTLNISGGTFMDYIYGGCAANQSSEVLKTTITGNISVTIDGGTTGNAISFGKSLFAGSMGNGVYTGNTTVTLKGDLSNITWAENAALYGANQGGSGADHAKSKTLVFNGASGDLGAFMNQTFDTVKFSNHSSVTLTGSTVYLGSIKTWNFDVSDIAIDLTWTNDGHDNRNDFADDTINLYGWDGETTRFFMTGCEEALNGWENATFHVYGADGIEIDESKYTITKTDNNLILNAVADESAYVNCEWTESDHPDDKSWGVNSFSSFSAAKNAGTTEKIYGVSEAGSTVSGVVALNGFLTDLQGNATYAGVVMGGARQTQGESAVFENGTQLSIFAGTFTKNVIGGGYAGNAENACLTQNGKSTLTIVNGIFDKAVAGGMYAYNASTSTNAKVILDAGTASSTAVDFTIYGGTFNGRIYGGNYACDDSATAANSVIDGSVNLVIDASENAIHILNGIDAGSRGTGSGMITGDVKVTFTGDGDNLDFGDIHPSVFGGCNMDGYKKCDESEERTVVSGVAGNRILSFDGFNGDFDANIRLFDTLVLKESDVNLAFDGMDLTDIGTWEFAEGTSTLKGMEEFDFKDDVLKLADGSSRTLFEGTGSTCDNWFSTITVGSLEYNLGEHDSTSATYSAGSSTLSLSLTQKEGGIYQLALA